MRAVPTVSCRAFCERGACVMLGIWAFPLVPHPAICVAANAQPTSTPNTSSCFFTLDPHFCIDEECTADRVRCVHPNVTAVHERAVLRPCRWIVRVVYSAGRETGQRAADSRCDWLVPCAQRRSGEDLVEDIEDVESVR